jgi:undecaprenyl-diphosphatase
LATLPGLSRSGSTVSALLLLGFQKSLSLKLSFLLSMPIVLAGNILLNLNTINFSVDNLVALTASFAFGLLTINLLLKLAKKINFGLLVIIFGLLTISSLFI